MHGTSGQIVNLMGHWKYYLGQSCVSHWKRMIERKLAGPSSIYRQSGREIKTCGAIAQVLPYKIYCDPLLCTASRPGRFALRNMRNWRKIYQKDLDILKLHPRTLHTSSCIYLSNSEKINRKNHSKRNLTFTLPKPELDFDYLCNPANLEAIRRNTENRKGVGDIDIVQNLHVKLNKKYKEENAIDMDYETETEVMERLQQKLLDAARDIPNMTHPKVPIGDETQAATLYIHGEKTEFSFKPKTLAELGKSLHMLRTDDVGVTTGPKTYYLLGDLAKLERALINFTVGRLKQEGFKMVIVPDIIHPSIIEACGFKTDGERTQVYKLKPHLHGDLCLAGTGEMPLAGYFCRRQLNAEKLPEKVMTVSRCYRAETADEEQERGIYRVHQFTKVEMFGVTANETREESSQLMEELINIQKSLFADIGLHFRVLDMPSQELGAPAYRKYDVEAWMPANQFWGEISSTSNCTDYQTRRLHIKYWNEDGELKLAHTVNGTGCAVPRMIMAILENFQQENGSVLIPKVLQPYMNGQTHLTAPEKPPQMKHIKLTKLYKRRGRNS